MLWIAVTLFIVVFLAVLINPMSLIHQLAVVTLAVSACELLMTQQVLHVRHPKDLVMTTVIVIANLTILWGAKALTHGKPYVKRFWMPLATVLITLNLLILPAYWVVQTIFGGIIIWFACVWLSLLLLMAAYFVTTRMAISHQISHPKIIIVLGAQVTVNGLSRTLRRRLDCTLRAYHQLDHKPLIVVSGGQGADEPQTEAQAMAAYLIQNGVPAKKIELETQATSTQENFRFSRLILNPQLPADTAFATSDYHVTRSRLLAANAGFSTIGVLAAPTSPESLFSATMRELVALTYYYRYSLAAIWGAAGAVIALLFGICH